MDKKINISWDILVKRVRWGLTPEEESVFQEWLAQDKSHEVYFERVRKVWGAEEPTSSLKSNLSKVMTHFDAYVEKEKELRRRRIMRNVYWYAACLLVVLSVGGGMWFFSQHDEPVKMEPKVAQDILPGGNKAIILLADGEEVDVEWLADSSRYKVDGIEVTTGEGKIRYKGKNDTKVEYNTIMIPRGGEYQVELSDGTKVWLNAETQLRIPTAFVGTERRVFLKGEAYFDVTKNDKQPFIVETDLGEVKVYGTQFNVKFYPEEKEIKATLVEGNIGFKSEEVAELKIKPGYQLRLAEGAKKPEVKPVKIYNEIAWKNRMFCFESERLESIMLKLERWYNVDIIFEDSGLKKFKFSGNLNRYDNIDKILHFFEEVFDVKFAVEENTIKVMRK